MAKTEVHINVGYGTPANAAKHADWASIVSALGFRGVSCDVGTVEWLGGALDGSGQDPAGIDAMCAAYGAARLPLCAVFYPQPPNRTAWKVPQGQPYGYSNPIVARRPDASVDSYLISGLQALIDRIILKYGAAGGDIDPTSQALSFQFGREPGFGGTGGPQSTTWGEFDGEVDGTTVRDDIAEIGEGTWDTSADWDELAGVFPTKPYQHVRGWHELALAVLSQLDLRRFTLVAPAFEHQLPTAYVYPLGRGAYSNASYIPVRERSTCAASWQSYCGVTAFNLYPGSYVGMPALGPRFMRDEFMVMASSAVSAFRGDAGLSTSIRSRPIWITETGFAWDWITPTGRTFSQEERGRYWRMLKEAAGAMPADRVYLYRLSNYVAGEDSKISGSQNFGMLTSTDQRSAGLLHLLQAHGTPCADADGVAMVLGGSVLSGATAS